MEAQSKTFTVNEIRLLLLSRAGKLLESAQGGKATLVLSTDEWVQIKEAIELAIRLETN